MEDKLLIALASVIVFGTGAQWLAWRLRLPSILLLLACGFVAGPMLHLVDPDRMLGDFLFPFVSVCVAIILFEGSLSLHFGDLRQIGAVLIWLLTAGVLITWALGFLGAHFILRMDWFPALILGSILVVTGPTVIGPLLRQIRPMGVVGPISRWEGIVIDPLGAVLAVLVFEAYKASTTAGVNAGSWTILQGLLLTLLYGGGIGTAGAGWLIWLLKRHAIPDHLESLITLLIVVLGFTSANILQSEAGLVTVTVMGVLVANSHVTLKPILEFKENLSQLLISSLFILLAARVDPNSFVDLGWRGLAFVTFMILVVRPISVAASTWNSSLTRKEKLFLAWMAPRGVVAAAVASIFAIELDGGAGLVPATFMLIVGTVVVYGLTAFPLARKLGLATHDPQGILIVGAHRPARAIGHAVQEAGFPVLLVDTNRWNIREARMAGLKTRNINILQEDAADSLDLGGIGRLLAMTPNDEVNSLAAMSFAELFHRASVYQLTPWRRVEKKEDTALHLRARYLFDEELTYRILIDRVAAGDQVKITRLTQEYSFETFQNNYHQRAIPLFVAANGRLTICDAEETYEFKAGQTLIALVPKVSSEGNAAETRMAIANENSS